MVGRFVMKDASQNLSKLILELGGSNPTIVDATCNLELTVKRLIWAKFTNAGQTCITCNHVYVHETVYDKFLEEMKLQLTTRLGKDAEESDDYSNIINTWHTKRILKMMEGQQDNIYFQNGRTNVEKCFIPPTILVDVPKDHPLIKDEIFGPLLPVLKFDNIDKVIEEINSGEKSLNINYYGDVKSRNYQKVKTQTSSGALLANDHLWNYFSHTTGFGGVGNSGNGRIRGFPGFEELSNKKTIIEKGRGSFLDIPFRYPPQSSNAVKKFKQIPAFMMTNTADYVFKRMKVGVLLVLLSCFIYYLFSRGIVQINL